MYNCRNQETIITVIPTSRHGQPFDIARVEAMFQLDEQLPETETLLVPQMELIPQDLLQALKLLNVHLAPMPESYVNQALSDYAQETADPNRDKETREDSAIGLVRKYLVKIPAQKVGTDNYYRVSYEYSLFPDENGFYNIYATLPFKGFNMPTGSQIRFITALPVGAQIDRDATRGTDLNQQLVDEQVTDVAAGRQIVSFFWQNDPDFVVKYRH